MRDYILEMKKITKDFSGVKALNNINLKLLRGEILSLCGENGAGKSTLMKVLSGVYPHGDFEGEILINGKKLINKSIKDSEGAGISIIHQELNLVNELTVMENIFLGSFITKGGVLQFNEMFKRTSELLKEVNLDISPTMKIKDLGIGEQQLVEIAKALSKNAKLLILDEPTAPLTETEVEILKKIIFKLKEKGVSCIYISHKLNEVMEISDEIAVIRDGCFVGSERKVDMTQEKIISMMVGRDMKNLFPKEEHKIGKVILEVKDFNVYKKDDRNKKRVKNINFDLKEGEILGVAGLIGSGRTELVSSIFGSYEGRFEGEVYLDGEKLNINSPKDALKNNITMVPEDRKGNGIVPSFSVSKNITLANLGKYKNSLNKMNEMEEIKDVNHYIEELRIKTSSLDLPIISLSGGNQQKVVIAKNILSHPKILILDEPTRGVDVGAKYEIYKYMFQLVKKGISIIMVSSELPEILGISDRVLVMHEGELKGNFDNIDLTQETIMNAAIGG